MERVTTVEKESPPVKVRQKDPKKVAAGKAGAAARKAKQEQLQTELRDAKAALHNPEKNEIVPVPEEVLHCNNTMTRQVVDNIDATPGSNQSAVDTNRHAVDWTPWVLGGVGLATVVWFVSRTKPATVSNKPIAVNTSQPIRHLNNTDPFNMQ